MLDKDCNQVSENILREMATLRETFKRNELTTNCRNNDSSKDLTFEVMMPVSVNFPCDKIVHVYVI